MASRIELEASYHLGENYEDILEKIKEQNFKLVEDSVEEDTCFTDKNLEFVKSRTCLRTRKTNEDFLELTYNSTEKYGKKEVNLRLDPKDYEDTKYVINQLGYIEYVSFKKYRQVYSKNINGFEYNIMIDKIDGVGNFIELEILANTEEEKEKALLLQTLEKTGDNRSKAARLLNVSRTTLYEKLRKYHIID